MISFEMITHSWSELTELQREERETVGFNGVFRREEMISGNQRRKEELAVLPNRRVVDRWPESRLKCRSSYNRNSDSSSSP